MSNDRNVIFRRVHGRLIPIKLNKDTSERVKGAAIVGAGIGVALAGGAVYKKAVISSAKAAFRGFNALDVLVARKGVQMSFDDIARINKFKNAANSSFRVASKLSKFSKVVRKFSPAVGEGLIAYGSFKFIKTLKQKDQKRIHPDIVYGGAAATTIIGSKAVELGRGAFHAGMYGKQGTFAFAKSNISSGIVNKIKDYSIKAFKARF